ncbi:MAG: hypothetical protein RLZZ04_4586, partial [Cyanobacteriota bacterium]
MSIFCLSQCSFQSDEIIEIPQSNPELAVY